MDFPYVFHNQMLWKIHDVLGDPTTKTGCIRKSGSVLSQKAKIYAFFLVDFGKYMFLHLRKK